MLSYLNREHNESSINQLYIPTQYINSHFNYTISLHNYVVQRNTCIINFMDLISKLIIFL